MRKFYLFLVIALLPLIAKSQVYSIPQYALDSVAKEVFRGELGALFNFSYEEMDDRMDFTLHLTSGLEYISGKHDYRMNIDWYYSRGDNEDDGHTHRIYLMGAVALHKYKMVNNKMVERSYFFAPATFYNRNTDRGLNWRHKIGMLFQPYGIKSKKVRFSFLVGAVFDYASWDVSENELKDDTPLPTPGTLGARITPFADTGSSSSKGRSRHIRDVRPMLMINFYYKPSRVFSADLVSYLFMPTSNPHSAEAKAENPRLKGLYPHVVLNLTLKFKVFKDLSLQAKLNADFERTRPTQFKQGYEWSMMMGLNWVFTTLKNRTRTN